MKMQNNSAHIVSARDHYVPLSVNPKLRGAVRKRHRTHFTNHQLETLEGIFSQTANPHRELVVRLSTHLNLTDKNISIWFKNRRAKVKREKKTNRYVADAERKIHLTSKQVSLDESQTFKQQNKYVLQDNELLSQNLSDNSFMSYQYLQNETQDVQYQLPPHQEQNIQKEANNWINCDHGADIGVGNSKFIGYMSAFQTSTSDVCGNDLNLYRQLSAPTSPDYDLSYPTHATSGNFGGCMNSYIYPVNYTSLLDSTLSSSLSPTSGVSSTSSNSVFFYDFQAIVSNLS